MSPTSCKNCNLERISLEIGSAIAALLPLNPRFPINSISCSICILAISSMFLSLIVTARE